MNKTRTGMAVAAIKTILANVKGEPTWEDWKMISDIALAQMDMPRFPRKRNTDYHVRHGKKKD